jgi:hypothetical protein
MTVPLPPPPSAIATTPAPASAPPPRRRGLLVVAVVIAVVGVLAVPAAVVAGRAAADADRDRDRIARQTAIAAGTTLPPAVVSALTGEQAYGAIALLGLEGALDLPVSSFGAATDATDRAVADFRAQLDDAGGAVAAAYGPTLDGLDGRLADLRSTVTAAGPRSLDQIDASGALFDGYAAVLADLRDADDALTGAIDSPRLRRGAQLVELARDQSAAMGEISRLLLFSGVSDGSVTTPDGISRLAGARSTLDANDATIAELATGDYQRAAAVLADDTALSQLKAAADDALRGGIVDLVAVVDGPRLGSDDDPYAVFESDVAATIARTGEERLAAAGERRTRWARVMVGALGVVVVATIAVAILLPRALRPRR